MELTLTLSVIGFGCALIVIALWQTSRPRKDSLTPRWIPWRFLIFVGGALVALGLAHASSLLGINVGARATP
jgi:hypothetical protein